MNSLIENGTLSKIETINGRQRAFCNCGKSVFLKGIKKHLKSKYHQKHFSSGVPVSSVNCDICYESKSEFFTCDTCRNQHCTSCHTRMNRCPFCRSNFPSLNTPPSNDRRTVRDINRQRDSRVTTMISNLLREINNVRGRENQSAKLYVLYRYILSEIEYMRHHRRFRTSAMSKLHELCDNGIEWAPEMLQRFQTVFY